MREMALERLTGLPVPLPDLTRFWLVGLRYLISRTPQWNDILAAAADCVRLHRLRIVVDQSGFSRYCIVGRINSGAYSHDGRIPSRPIYFAGPVKRSYRRHRAQAGKHLSVEARR